MLRKRLQSLILPKVRLISPHSLGTWLARLISKPISSGVVLVTQGVAALVAEDALGTSQSQAVRALGRSFRTQTSALQESVKQAGTEAAASTSTAGLSSPPSQGLRSVPTLVKALGFGGALPFWAFSPAVAPSLPLDLLDASLITNAGLLQVGYGATIISFLGGVHWGLAMTSITPVTMMGQRYLWSVLPCLMAWPTVAMPIGQGAGIQAALLGLVYVVDAGWARRGSLPPWYMSLRLPLTVLAASGLALTAATQAA